MKISYLIHLPSYVLEILRIFIFLTYILFIRYFCRYFCVSLRNLCKYCYLCSFYALSQIFGKYDETLCRYHFCSRYYCYAYTKSQSKPLHSIIPPLIFLHFILSFSASPFRLHFLLTIICKPQSYFLFLCIYIKRH